MFSAVNKTPEEAKVLKDDSKVIKTNEEEIIKDPKVKSEEKEKEKEEKEIKEEEKEEGKEEVKVDNKIDIDVNNATPKSSITTLSELVVTPFKVNSPVSTPLSTLAAVISKVKEDATETERPETEKLGTPAVDDNDDDSPSSPMTVTAGPPAPASTSAPICQNCATSTTPLWRRDEAGQVLCNACGLFLKLHGRSRPISLKTDVIKSRNRIKNSHRDSGSNLNCNSGPASYPNSPAHGPIMSSTGSLTSSPRLNPQGSLMNDKKSNNKKNHIAGSKSSSGGRKSGQFGSTETLPSLLNLDHPHAHSHGQPLSSYGSHMVMNGHHVTYAPNSGNMYPGSNPYSQQPQQHHPNMYPGMSMSGGHHSPSLNQHSHPDLPMYANHMVMNHLPHAHHLHNHPPAHMISHPHGHPHGSHNLLHHLQSSGANTPTGIVSPSLAPLMNQGGSGGGGPVVVGGSPYPPPPPPPPPPPLASRFNSATSSLGPSTTMSPILPEFHTFSPYGRVSSTASSGANSPVIKIATESSNDKKPSHLNQSQTQSSSSGLLLPGITSGVNSGSSTQQSATPVLKKITSPLLLSMTTTTTPNQVPDLGDSPTSMPTSTPTSTSSSMYTSSLGIANMSNKMITTSGTTTLAPQTTIITPTSTVGVSSSSTTTTQCLPQRTALDHLSSAASQSSYLSGRSDNDDDKNNNNNTNNNTTTTTPATRTTTPEQSEESSKALKTRVAELELVNDLFKSRVAELEVSELAARRSEAAIRETEIMLRNNLYRLENKNMQILEKNRELKNKLKELVESSNVTGGGEPVVDKADLTTTTTTSTTTTAVDENVASNELASSDPTSNKHNLDDDDVAVAEVKKLKLASPVLEQAKIAVITPESSQSHLQSLTKTDEVPALEQGLEKTTPKKVKVSDLI